MTTERLTKTKPKRKRCPNCGGIWIIWEGDNGFQRCKRCDTTWTITRRNEIKNVRIGSTEAAE